MLFDAVGTLFRVRGSVGEIYARHARPLGLDRSAELYRAAFLDAFAHMSPLAFPGVERAEIPAFERGWWRELVGKVLDAVKAPGDFDRERYFDDVYQAFAGADGWQLHGDALPALTALEARGVSLGIVSNFDSRCRAVCEELGILGFVDHVTLSSEAGVAKPNPAIYAAAARAHGVPPDEILHVGDDAVNDAIAARAIGMKALLLARRSTRATPGGVMRISSLTEIPDRLDGDWSLRP